MSRHLSERWESNLPADRLFRWLLAPAAWLYAFGWQAYRAIYDLGMMRPSHPHCPIVCTGNLVVGGTGKSPVVVYIAKLLRELGFEVVIGASGYGSPNAEAAQLAPDGLLKASDWGDEPAMLRELLPDVPLIVGRRRVLAAQTCHDKFPNAVLLMDDGFQHLPLKKDLTILLDPERVNRFTIPAGPYREPRGNRKRADLILPGQFKVVAEPVHPEIGPCRASVLCALGQPRGFLISLKEAGFEIVATKLLPDHDKMLAGNLFEGLPPDLPILVTSKDWVKLRERTDLEGRRIVVARHEVRIEPEEDFRRWLAARMHELTSKTTAE